MKKLDIKLGGHPLTGDDLLFLQNALAEAINGIANSLYGDFCILSGCDTSLSGGTLTWTDGWVFLSGELCKIDAGSAAYDGSNRFQIVETYDSAGDLVYESLSTEHTYVVRKATIDAGGHGTGSALGFSNVYRFKDVRTWQVITPLGSWSWSGISVSTQLNPIGEVVFRGSISVTSYNNSTDSKICTLAAQFRPQEKRTYLCAAIIAGTKTFIHVEVDSNGDVNPLGISASQAATIFLDGIKVTKGIF